MSRNVLVALDRERHLRFDVNAVCDLETALGFSLGELFGPGRAGLTVIRAAMWAGLKHEDASLSIAGAGNLLQGYLDRGGSFAQVGEWIREALALAGFGGNADDAKAPEGGAGPFPSGSGSPPPSS